jgi:phage shock protein C
MNKRLERDQEKAVVSGVLAGLAKYFNQDPSLFRIFAIVFLIITGVFPGILFYIAAWILMPKKPVSTNAHTVEYEVVE